MIDRPFILRTVSVLQVNMLEANFMSKVLNNVLSSRVSVRLCIAAIIRSVISLGWSYLRQYLKRNDLIGSVLSRDSMTEYTRLQRGAVSRKVR
jgi:hypothetical protein